MTKVQTHEHAQFSVENLISHIKQILPAIVPTALDGGELIEGSSMEAVWERFSTMDFGVPKAIHCEIDKCIYCFVYPDDRAGAPAHILKVALSRSPGNGVVKFVRMFMVTVNNDLHALLLVGHGWEQVWRALKSTQLQRTIAHCSSFNFHPCDDWLSMMDSSAHMTYEGVSSQVMAVVIKNSGEFRARVPGAFMPLSMGISFTQALFHEKWVRSFVDGERIALVVSDKKGGRVVGFLLIEELQESKGPVKPLFCPHRSLRLLSQRMANGEMAMVNARNGDTYVMMAGHDVFWRKHQGRWSIVDPYVLYAALLEAEVENDTAIALVRVCLDLSFERQGALLCVVSDDRTESVSQMVADHRSPERINGPLRLALAGKAIGDWRQRQLVSAAAGTDGATVLNKKGKVLDIACMIGDVPKEELDRRGITQRSFPGARSRAAWNSSVFGTSIKVSDDGPITVWSQGKELCSIG